MIFDLFHFHMFPCFLNVGVIKSMSDYYFHFLPSTDRIIYLASGAKIVWPIPDLYARGRGIKLAASGHRHPQRERHCRDRAARTDNELTRAGGDCCRPIR
jgi:hypothetical protein